MGFQQTSANVPLRPSPFSFARGQRLQTSHPKSSLFVVDSFQTLDAFRTCFMWPAGGGSKRTDLGVLKIPSDHETVV